MPDSFDSILQGILAQAQPGIPAPGAAPATPAPSAAATAAAATTPAATAAAPAAPAATAAAAAEPDEFDNFLGGLLEQQQVALPQGFEAWKPIGKDKNGRPIVVNPKGMVSSEIMTTLPDPRTPGAFINVPTLYGGKKVSGPEALDIVSNAGWKDPDTGKPIQSFASRQAALDAEAAHHAEVEQDPNIVAADTALSDAIEKMREQPPPEKLPEGALGRLGHWTKSSLGTAKGSLAALAASAGADPDFAAQIIANSGYGEGEQSEALKKVQEQIGKDEWFGAIGTTIRHPVDVVGELMAESLGPMLPSIGLGWLGAEAGGAGGALVGSVVPGPGTAAGGLIGGALGLAGGVGLGSGGIEYGSTFLDTMKAEGVNLRDEAAVAKALRDPAMRAKARAEGLKRGIPVGIFDAITAGLAGKILGVAGEGVKRKVAGGLGELAMQAVGGAGGEAAAQFVQKGTITDPFSIYAEAIAEVPSGIVETGLGAHEAAKRQVLPGGDVPIDLGKKAAQVQLSVENSEVVARQGGKVVMRKPYSAAQTDTNSHPLKDSAGNVVGWTTPPLTKQPAVVTSATVPAATTTAATTAAATPPAGAIPPTAPGTTAAAPGAVPAAPGVVPTGMPAIGAKVKVTAPDINEEGETTGTVAGYTEENGVPHVILKDVPEMEGQAPRPWKLGEGGVTITQTEAPPAAATTTAAAAAAPGATTPAAAPTGAPDRATLTTGHATTPDAAVAPAPVTAITTKMFEDIASGRLTPEKAEQIAPDLYAAPAARLYQAGRIKTAQDLADFARDYTAAKLGRVDTAPHAPTVAYPYSTDQVVAAWGAEPTAAPAAPAATPTGATAAPVATAPTTPTPPTEAPAQPASLWQRVAQIAKGVPLTKMDRPQRARLAEVLGVKDEGRNLLLAVQGLSPGGMPGAENVTEPRVSPFIVQGLLKPGVPMTALDIAGQLGLSPDAAPAIERSMEALADRDLVEWNGQAIQLPGGEAAAPAAPAPAEAAPTEAAIEQQIEASEDQREGAEAADDQEAEGADVPVPPEEDQPDAEPAPTPAVETTEQPPAGPAPTGPLPTPGAEPVVEPPAAGPSVPAGPAPAGAEPATEGGPVPPDGGATVPEPGAAGPVAEPKKPTREERREQIAKALRERIEKGRAEDEAKAAAEAQPKPEAEPVKPKTEKKPKAEKPKAPVVPKPPVGTPRVRNEAKAKMRAEAKAKAKEALKGLSKEAIQGADKAASAITALLGAKPGRLTSGIGFDEDTYKAMKPHFRDLMGHLYKAGMHLEDLLDAVSNYLRSYWTIDQIDQGLPYVSEFVGEMMDEGEAALQAAAAAAKPTEEPKAEEKPAAPKPEEKKPEAKPEAKPAEPKPELPKGTEPDGRTYRTVPEATAAKKRGEFEVPLERKGNSITLAAKKAIKGGYDYVLGHVGETSRSVAQTTDGKWIYEPETDTWFSKELFPYVAAKFVPDVKMSAQEVADFLIANHEYPNPASIAKAKKKAADKARAAEEAKAAEKPPAPKAEEKKPEAKPEAKKPALKPNEARIVFYNDLYRVFVADGLYEKEVWTARTEEGALRYLRENNLVEAAGRKTAEEKPKAEAKKPEEKKPTTTPVGEAMERAQLVQRISARLKELIPTAKNVEVTAGKIADAIDGDYNDALHPSNQKSRQIFTELTGVKLPPTVAATVAMFRDHAGPFDVIAEGAAPSAEVPAETKPAEPAPAAETKPALNPAAAQALDSWRALPEAERTGARLIGLVNTIAAGLRYTDAMTEEARAQAIAAADAEAKPAAAPKTIGEALAGRGSLTVGIAEANGERFLLRIVPDSSEPARHSLQLMRDGKTQSFRMKMRSDTTLDEMAARFQDYLNTDTEGSPWKVTLTVGAKPAPKPAEAAPKPAETKPTEAAPPKPAHWLNDLGESTEPVRVALRDIRAQSDRLVEEGNKLSPKPGEVGVGSAHMEPFLRGEGLAAFLRQIGKGHDPAAAAALAKAEIQDQARAARKKYGWHHLPDGIADSTIDAAQEKVEAVAAGKPAPAAETEPTTTTTAPAATETPPVGTDTGATAQQDQPKTEGHTLPSTQLAGDLLPVLDTIMATEDGKLTWQQLFAAADKAYGGTQAEGKYTPKDAYDALELAVNQWVKAYNQKPDGAIDTKLADIEKLLDKLPTQTKRTEEMERFQQFSTPPHYAAAVAHIANIGPNDIVLEPSAGVGGLAVHALDRAQQVFVNELSPRRADLLRALPFTGITSENAEHLNAALPADIRPTVVVMNPPFSQTAGRLGDKKVIGTAARHISEALKRLEPGGRLVAIVGEGMTPGAPAYRAFFQGLAEQGATLRANVSVGDKVYGKYGTSFGTRVLVIDKALMPVVTQTGHAETVQQLVDMLKVVHDDRRAAAPEQRPAEPGGQAPAVEGGEGPVSAGPVSHPAPGVGPGERPAKPKRGGRVAGVAAGPAAGEGAQPAEGGGVDGALGAGGGGRPDGGGAADTGRTEDHPRIEVGATTLPSGQEVFTDSLFTPYTPQRLQVPGAQPHPGKLVQSSAMAAVLPPVPTYNPKLPQSVVKKGELSLPQLESVVYAGQAHSQMLPTVRVGDQDVTYRRGFFIGDGTGVGKGREIAGVIADNWHQGRKKAVWITKDDNKLYKAAVRDLGALGVDNKNVRRLPPSPGTPILHDEGVIVLSYDKLKKPERLKQILDWLGDDNFDGVIAFDEAHKMGNALAVRGVRGMSQPSKVALAGMDLQRAKPNARVLYVSATGATEVSNLAYADRLGLWGPGTAFEDKATFINNIDAGGVAAMELVARDMKALGAYISRNLSYDDVQYERLEHKLTEPQRAMYDRLAEAWQGVLANMEKALELNGEPQPNGNVKVSPEQKSWALSKFWSAHQRFFNQIITSMQTVSVIDSVKKDIADGHSVVLQLVNTNDAATQRALANNKDADLDALDITPRDGLMEMVKKSFPIHQQETYEDEDGNERWRPAVDSAGNPIINPEAVALRDQLLKDLEDIQVPGGPLEYILDEFGTDAVAEVTGRDERVVRDKATGKRVKEKHPPSARQKDIEAFQNDKKRILIFSAAGGTGVDYHASLDVKNQRLRRHYLLQPGFRADEAVQGLGRTHRSNQRQAPSYILVHTDLHGQKRFLSTIARRLAQLGALTKGQSKASSGELFSEKDNLESEFAQDAINSLLRDLALNQVEGLTFDEFEKQTGLDMRGREGDLRELTVPRFLNRLLSMKINEQNIAFDAFYDRLLERLEVAKARGELAKGVETYQAATLKTVERKTVYTHEATGATTDYVKIREGQKTKKIPFSQVSGDQRVAGFYRNKKSGRVYAVSEPRQSMSPQGKLESVRMLRAPDGKDQVVDTNRIYGMNWEEIRDRGDAEKAWNEALSKVPELEYKDLHLITGVLLPIWDRLGEGEMQVYRLQTDDGDQMLGRVIPPKSVQQVLAKLGATSGDTITAAQALERIKAGGPGVRLVNDWRIQRRLVSNEVRYEIVPPSAYFTPAQANELRTAGAFLEAIQWRERAFIPTGVRAETVLANILKNHPVMGDAEPVETAQGAAAGPEAEFAAGGKSIFQRALAAGGAFTDATAAFTRPSTGLLARVRRAVTRTPAFRAWFGDSKVVDENGDPLIVFHGTGGDIEAFDLARRGLSTEHATAHLGFFFSGNPEIASEFVPQQLDLNQWPPEITPKPGGNIVPVYLSIQNPKVMSTTEFRQLVSEVGRNKANRVRVLHLRQQLIAQHYDGIKIEGDPKLRDTMAGAEFAADTWIAFHPEQVKSATGNRGTFARDDPRINYRAGVAPEAQELRDTFTAEAQAKGYTPAQSAVMYEDTMRMFSEEAAQLGIPPENILYAMRLTPTEQSRAARRASGIEEGGHAGGVTVGQVAALSLEHAQEGTMLHEGVHIIINALPKDHPIRRLLDRETERLRPLAMKVAPEGAALPTNEVQAYAGEAYLMARKRGEPVHEVHAGLRHWFDKVERFFRRFGNMLRGMGFRTAEDVYAAMGRGELGRHVTPQQARAETFERAGVTPEGVQGVQPLRPGEPGEQVFDDPLNDPPTPEFRMIPDLTNLAIEAVGRGRKAQGSAEKIAEARDWLVWQMQNRMLPMIRNEAYVERELGRELTPEERVSEQETLMSDRANARVQELLDQHYVPFLKAEAAAGLSRARGLVPGFEHLSRVEEYALAEHAEERNREMFKRNPRVLLRLSDGRRLGFSDEPTAQAALASIRARDPKITGKVEVRSGGVVEGAGSGMTNAEAQQVKDNAVRDGLQTTLHDLADRIRAISRYEMETRVETGRVSRHLADILRARYPNYINLSGVAELDEEGDIAGRTGRGIDPGKAKDFTAATGRRSPPTNILAHGLMAAQEAIHRGERNRVMQGVLALAKAPIDKADADLAAGTITKAERDAIVAKARARLHVDKMGIKAEYSPRTGLVTTKASPRLSREEELHTLRVKVDGVEHRVTVGDDRLARALKNLDGDQLGIVFRQMGKLNRFFSHLATNLNPLFFATNPIRDIQTALVTLPGMDMKGLTRSVMRDYRKALAGMSGALRGKEATRMQKIAKQFTLAGGRTSTLTPSDLRSTVRSIERERRMMEKGSVPAAMRAVRGLGRAVDHVNSTLENAVRLATFANVRSRLASKAGLSAAEIAWFEDGQPSASMPPTITPAKVKAWKVAEDTAARAGKNVTVNFARRGMASPIFNALYMFFNAGVQGNATLLHWAARSKTVRRTFVGLVLSGLMLDMLNAAGSDDDDDGQSYWDKMPEDEKVRNWKLMLPGHKDKAITLPQPWGINALISTGRIIGEFLRGHKDAWQATSDIISAWANTLSPISTSGSMLDYFTPSWAKPVVGSYLNKTWFGADIKPPKVTETQPESQRFYPSATQTSRFLTDQLNRISGGNEFLSGGLDWSPAVVDYLAAQYTSGVGRFVGRTVDMASKILEGESPAWRDIPFAGTFVQGKRASADKSIFYEHLAEAQTAYDNFHGLAKSGQRQAALDAKAEDPVVISMFKAMDKARATLADIRKDRVRAEKALEDGKITTAERDRKLEMADEREKAVLTKWNAAWYQKVEQPRQQAGAIFNPRGASAPAAAASP